MYIDAHLDLAFNAQLGRDLTLSLSELRAHDPVAGQRAAVTFDEIRRAGVGLCFGTLFALPQTDAHAGYTTWQEARAQAQAQLEQYQRWQDAGHIRLLTTGEEVQRHAAEYSAEAPLGVVLLIEGADPLRDVDDLPYWYAAGVRAIGLAWGQTRYAGGTDAPGPLSDRGRDLLAGMRDLGVIQDMSHLDEEAFFEAAELQPRIMASHSNSRTFVPTNRQLSDDMARTVAAQGGVIGLVLLSKFLWPRAEFERAPLSEVTRHAEHFAKLVGEQHVGLGSDLDGGFGVEKMPLGLERYADIAQLELGQAVMGGNWLRFLSALP